MLDIDNYAQLDIVYYEVERYFVYGKQFCKCKGGNMKCQFLNEDTLPSTCFLTTEYLYVDSYDRIPSIASCPLADPR